MKNDLTRRELLGQLGGMAAISALPNVAIFPFGCGGRTSSPPKPTSPDGYPGTDDQLLEEIEKNVELKTLRVAFLIDEAHRSQEGQMGAAIRLPFRTTDEPDADDQQRRRLSVHDAESRQFPRARTVAGGVSDRQAIEWVLRRDAGEGRRGVGS